jgi:hypothetical protein
MHSKKSLFLFLQIIGTSISVFSQQLDPSISFSNIAIDLKAIYLFGTRPVSGTIHDYLTIQGAIQKTDNKYDLAVNGLGFFRIKDHETGEYYYTRYGSFVSVGEKLINQANDSIDIKPANNDLLNTLNSRIIKMEFYYPVDEKDVVILDNYKFKLKGEIKQIDGAVLNYALEENPIELDILLSRLRICLRTIDNSIISQCITSINSIQNKMRNKPSAIEIKQGMNLLNEQIRMICVEIEKMY